MDYKEKYYDQILETIHYIIKINNQEVPEEKQERIDKLIRQELEDYFDHEEENARLLKGGKPGNVTSREIVPFVTKYFAISQDNLDLLRKLEANEFNFNGADGVVNLYPLDKMLSSKFKEDYYVKLLSETPRIVSRFYNSLHFADDKEKEENIKDFAEILNKNPEVIKRPNVRKKSQSYYNNLLTKRNIEYFGKDFLINASPEQKEVIDGLNFVLAPQDFAKIKELLEKYPYFRKKIELDSVILSAFTVDEIANMSLKDAILYDTAKSAGVFERMRSLLKKNPSFDCPSDFIRVEIFKCLDDETILSLTREGKEEISKLKIPTPSNAVIFPYRKINKAVIKDRRRRKKEEKKAFQKSK